jgi:hypothetical protein
MRHAPKSLAARLAVATLAVAAATTGMTTSRSAAAAPATSGEVSMLILRENGVGSSARAQKFIDDLMVSFARVNGWSSASGKYHTTRQGAEAYIAASKPSYGFFSLGAYLALRDDHKLTPLGKSSIAGGGGEQYYIVSKIAASLEQCKGKSLATNHGDDAKFVDKVLFDGKMSLSDFEVVQTRRPLQTLKKVTRDEATCALVDDAQMAALADVDDGSSVKPVWFSKHFPAVIVAAFPNASDSKGFAAKLPDVCEGEGKAACDGAGVRNLATLGASDLSALHTSYGK